MRKISIILRKKNFSKPSVEDAKLILCGTYQALKIIPFSVELPDAEPTETVVGQVTLFSESAALVWFGWGHPSDTSSVARKLPNMGPLSVSFPRTYGNRNDRPVSQLLNGSSSPAAGGGSGVIAEEDEEEVAILTQNIAGRLSGKAGVPVYVTCGLSGLSARNGSDNIFYQGASGISGASRAIIAASLAEREAGRILQERVVELKAG